MTQQLDLLGIAVADAGMQRRLQSSSPKARDVKRPHLAQHIAHPGIPPAKSCALVDVPRAANADPETSHLAADRMKASGALTEQQNLVRDWVKRWPGLTSAELAAEYAKVIGGPWQQHRPMFGRRLPELAVRHVKRGDPRDCRVTGSPCTTWWPQ